MNQILIGLHGMARTGKDTAAAYLATHFQLLSYAFAQPLKLSLAQLFHLNSEQLEGAQKEVPLPGIGKSPRELMQLLGTDWGRHLVHPDLWLLLAEQNLNAMAELHQGQIGFVLRDVRFENEAAWVRRQGGVIIHIRRAEAALVNPHISEAGIALHDQDFVLHNDQDLPHFYQQLDQLMAAVIRNHIQRPAA